MPENRIGQSSLFTDNSGDVFQNTLSLIFKHWQFVVCFALACAIIAGCISFLVPNRYTATASILPTSSNAGASGLLSMAENIPGIDLSAISGDKSPTLLYPEILKSRLVAEEILANNYTYKKGERQVNQNLFQYLKITNPDRAIAALNSHVDFSADRKTGVIAINVTTKNPELSALVANYYTECLDNFNKYQRKTSAGQNREFIEKRMAEARVELTSVEENLRDLRQRNLNYYNATDPELNMLNSQLQREVEIKTQVYLTLCQQYELASIQEKKESPVVQVLDIARPPTIKSGPSRLKTVILALIMGAILAMIIVILENRRPELGRSFKENLRFRKFRFARKNQPIDCDIREHVEKY